jgi:hypothetical protein
MEGQARQRNLTVPLPALLNRALSHSPAKSLLGVEQSPPVRLLILLAQDKFFIFLNCDQVQGYLLDK